jgi:hypothetical protein
MVRRLDMSFLPVNDHFMARVIKAFPLVEFRWIMAAGSVSK